ncbi:hypothetical protein N9N46_01090 [Candidatus Pelagibacter ubique]|nr:hypothetical protein [Candidatus Pelagibacter ubique]
MSIASEYEIEQKFILSQKYILSKQFKKSSEILKELTQITNSTRIELEYARSLYYEKKYLDAKKIFKKIYDDKDTPYQVKSTISKFLKDINNKLGYFDFNLSIVSEQNPGNDPGKGTYTVFGWLPLNYSSNSDENETIYGTLGEINFGKKLFNSTLFRTNLRARTFGKDEYSIHDRNELNISVLQNLPNYLYLEPNFYVHEKTDQNYKVTSNKFGFAKLFNKFYIDLNRSFGYRDFKTNNSLNSDIWSNSLTLVTGEFFNADISLNFIEENVNSKNDLNSFNNDTYQVSFTKKILNNRFILDASYSNSKTDYDKFDNFWFEKRNDEIDTFRAGLCDRNLRIFNRYICFESSMTNSKSNIDFFSYDAKNFLLTFKKF